MTTLVGVNRPHVNLGAIYLVESFEIELHRRASAFTLNNGSVSSPWRNTVSDAFNADTSVLQIVI